MSEQPTPKRGLWHKLKTEVRARLILIPEIGTRWTAGGRTLEIIYPDPWDVRVPSPPGHYGEEHRARWVDWRVWFAQATQVERPSWLMPPPKGEALDRDGYLWIVEVLPPTEFSKRCEESFRRMTFEDPMLRMLHRMPRI